MNRLIKEIISTLNPLTLILFFYSIFDSLVFSNKIGLVSLIILFIYFVLNLRLEYPHKKSFIVATLLIVMAIILYVLDTTDILTTPIRKLSEWAYLLLIVGAVQLFIPNEK